MKSFYLGLDVGTSSVGIACTDEQYRLLHAKGKDLWATRLFDEAKPASQRRAARTARRRLARRACRIDLLQEIFMPFISEKDANFFMRLNNSGFYAEDKDYEVRGKNSLFADKDFCDKDFYKQFPTIFHLRKALTSGEEKYDLRLYYMALHHIIKYRGHFLDDTPIDVNQGNKAIFQNLISKLNDQCEDMLPDSDVYFDLKYSDAFAEIFKNRRLNKKEKVSQALSLFGVRKAEKPKKEKTDISDFVSMTSYVELLMGNTVRYNSLFGPVADKKDSICFEKVTDETILAEEEKTGEYFALLLTAFELYKNLSFQRICGDGLLSDAMIENFFNKHKSDLKWLKETIKKYYPKETYKLVFETALSGDNAKKIAVNYANYIGYTKIDKKKVNVKKCGVDDFKKALKKFLTDIKPDNFPQKEFDLMFERIGADDFLPKISKADNGTFPHQANGVELKLILQQLGKQYPQFAEKGIDGLSAIDKIEALFLFRIPYYVGPLVEKSKYSNLVRKEGETGRITPWTFDKIVDKHLSNEKFIRKMTNKCTYLYSCDVLPKCSLLYQEFMLLNQINNLTIDSVPISVVCKQKLFDELFKANKKVTNIQIKKFLVNNGFCKKDEVAQIVLGGINENCVSSLTSYVELSKILGRDFVDNNRALCEDIILRHTLHTDKKLVADYLADKYGDIPEIKNNVKALCRLTCFKEFGRLSKEFLLLAGINKTTGEHCTLIGEMYNTNQNMMSLIYSDRYTFKDELSKANDTLKSDIDIEDLEKMGLAPYARRSVWQALRMVDEYVSAVGKTPDKIFIETARKKTGNHKQTPSRRKQLEEIYAAIKDLDSIRDLTLQLVGNGANDSGKEDFELRQDKLYLYFLQLGKCAYTGEQIDLARLNTKAYDIDHIVPQSLTKDDSIDNRVLVIREVNDAKKNFYPVPQKFRQEKLWDVLKEKGLMSPKKYALLTRKTPLTDDDLRGFVQRQMTSTNQSTKILKDILEAKYPDSQVVFSKASWVVEFKQKYDIVKCRETNDFHHARDAYLNIVAGNVNKTNYDKMRFVNDGLGVAETNNYFKKLYEFGIENAWDSKNSITTVKNTLSKTTMCVTRYTKTTTGEFYDATVYAKNDGAVTAPRKNKGPYKDTSKYGGFKSQNTAYFAVVQSIDAKGKKQKTIEQVPVLAEYSIKGDVVTLQKYFESVGFDKPEILVAKIKPRTVVKIGKTPCTIRGITGQQISFVPEIQWRTTPDQDRYVNALLKLVSMFDKKDDPFKESYPIRQSTEGITLQVDRNGNEKLFKTIEEQMSKDIYGGVTGVKNALETLRSNESNFMALSVLSQAKCLLGCVAYLAGKSDTVDLSLMGGSKHAGKCLISKNITDKSLRIVHMSPCGLKQREVIV